MQSMNAPYIPEALQDTVFGALLPPVLIGYGAGATIGVSILALHRLRSLYDRKKFDTVVFIALVSLVTTSLALAFLIAPLGVSATQKGRWDADWLSLLSLYAALLGAAWVSWLFSNANSHRSS